MSYNYDMNIHLQLQVLQ